MFEREDWKLFRNIETLCQKAGVSKEVIPRLVIKELVDNALDTDTECNFGLLAGNGFFVEDRGNGIDPARLGEYFSINRPMITTKLLRLPTRGALGNGLRVVVGAVIATGGKILVCTQGGQYGIHNQENGTSTITKISRYDQPGTRIELFFGPNLPVIEKDLDRGKYAKIFKQGNSFRCKTSPHWYTSEAFYELTDAYIGDVFSLCRYFGGIGKERARVIAGIFNNCPTKDLSFIDSGRLLNQLRENNKVTNPNTLGLCGDMKGYYGEYAKKIGIFRQNL